MFLRRFSLFEVLHIVGVGDIGDGVAGLRARSGGFLKNGVRLVLSFYPRCGVVAGGEYGRELWIQMLLNVHASLL